MLVNNLLVDPPDQGHLALAYGNNQELDSAISTYVNEGLSRGQLCVYATVHLRDEGHIEKFSSLILDYEENVAKGNLLVVDLAPFYISSLMGDMKPFEEAKKLFAEKAKDRKDKRVRFVGDGTGFLFKNKHFDECAMIEQWWQEKPFEGSYLCPYAKQFLDTYPHDIHAKRAVVLTHDSIVDVSPANLPKPDILGKKYYEKQEQMSITGEVQNSSIQAPNVDRGELQ